MPSKAIIFSGPSGVGKTTIVQYLLKHNSLLSFSISACTRPKRAKEIHGKDYYFLSKQQFIKKICQKEFIEWEQVYQNYYGTLKKEVEKIWAAKKIVIFDVDVVGSCSLKRFFFENALSIYIKPPNEQILLQRLATRKTESEEVIKKRLEKIPHEMFYAKQFDTILINEELSTTLKKAQHITDQFLQCS